jgi:hypothetical protein
VHEFIKSCGYPSLGETIHLLTNGNIYNIPTKKPVDVEHAYKIFGPHLEYIREYMVRKMMSRMLVDHMLRYMDKNLKVYTDIMHGIGSGPVKPDTAL